MQQLTQKQALGLSGELLVHNMLNQIFKDDEDTRIKTNDFKNYTKSIEKGVDFKVYYRHEPFYAIEVKNWLLQNKPYGTEIAINEIISRFEGLRGFLKVLIISYDGLLTVKARRLLKQSNIHIISINKVMSIRKDNPRVNPQFFHALKRDLQDELEMIEEAHQQLKQYNQLLIDEYLNQLRQFQLRRHNWLNRYYHNIEKHLEDTNPTNINKIIETHDTPSKKMLIERVIEDVGHDLETLVEHYFRDYS